MKKLLFLFGFMLFAMNTWAVKASPEPATITQSDGTQLTIIGYGDEDYHWYTTTDGVILSQIGHDYFVSRILPTGQITTTTQLAHNPGERNDAEKSLAKAQLQHHTAFFQHADSERLRAMKQRIAPGTPTPAYFPHTGSPKAMVILVEFTDTVFSVSDPYTVFNEYLNSEEKLPNHGLREDRNYGSVRQFFKDMSGGLFTPQFDVFGPVAMPKASGYYGDGNKDNNNRIREMVREACAAINDTVDFSQYDSNGDGYVDLVYIIYAGYSESVSGNSADCIWPKSGTMSGGTYDGVTVSRYGINNELNYHPNYKFSQPPYKRINGIGLFCHEFSHTMGLPDLYPTSSQAMAVDNQTMEYWDIMDGGEYTDNGYTPTPYTPWEKDVMGWCELEELSDTAQVTLLEDQYYTISSADNAEYLIIQNLQGTGWASALSRLGHGLLVYRIDYKNSTVNLGDYPNNTAGRPGITIVPADSLLINYYRIYGNDEANKTEQKPYSLQEYQASHAGDPYPGTSDVRNIAEFKLNSTTIEKPIYNIEETDGVITFDFLKDFAASSITPTYRNSPDRSTRSGAYDLHGRRLPENRTNTQGVYIRNGRKVAVK